MTIKKSGFTLLELLVVIGIIAILVALATVSYSATQRQGRNTKRKQDVVAIQNALEQYYSNNGYKYPSGSCTAAATYLQGSWPTDPDTGAAYENINSCFEDRYCVCARLEGRTDSIPATDGNTTNMTVGATGCTWDGGKANYCVGNLQ